MDRGTRAAGWTEPRAPGARPRGSGSPSLFTCQARIRTAVTSEDSGDVGVQWPRRARGWASLPATVGDPGGRRICSPLSDSGGAVVGGRQARGAGLGGVVQAALQARPQLEHLLLQLSDGLAGVRAEKRVTAGLAPSNPCLHTFTC